MGELILRALVAVLLIYVGWYVFRDLVRLLLLAEGALQPRRGRGDHRCS